MGKRSFCVHAHFYQPPREDPLLGTIPIEPEAFPYPNWNERIYAECYKPNAELGNFQHISFDVGPTLLEWMQAHHPETSRLIIQQDHANQRQYGVGNAMAQPYHHTILPLATREDKITQIVWGLAEFEYRLGRKAVGMWLPETAVDMETLILLADFDIQFTILAPSQAEAASLDPTEPYRVLLDGNRSLTVFFYHQELSTAVSFDPASTRDADYFVQHALLPYFQRDKLRQNEPQLIVIASDGELYGHHQRFRDLFLARLLNGAGLSSGVETSFPSLWLKTNPPRGTIPIRENTSWSCPHGLKRWKEGCECTPGTSNWKAPLRQAIDRLAAELDNIYIDSAHALGFDPWELRNRYIHVILGLKSTTELIAETVPRPLTSQQIGRLSLLLEAQHQRQQMFASCGWYHEDFARIEPKNTLAYAASAICFTYQATGIDLSPQTQTDLQKVISLRTGLRGDSLFRQLYDRMRENFEVAHGTDNPQG